MVKEAFNKKIIIIIIIIIIILNNPSRLQPIEGQTCQSIAGLTSTCSQAEVDNQPVSIEMCSQHNRYPVIVGFLTRITATKSVASQIHLGWYQSHTLAKNFSSLQIEPVLHPIT